MEFFLYISFVIRDKHLTIKHLNIMNKVELVLNIDNISDELYQLLLNEFKKQSEEMKIDFDSYEDQEWKIKCELN